jgi:hypothetical protein
MPFLIVGRIGDSAAKIAKNLMISMMMRGRVFRLSGTAGHSQKHKCFAESMVLGAAMCHSVSICVWLSRTELWVELWVASSSSTYEVNDFPVMSALPPSRTRIGILLNQP